MILPTKCGAAFDVDPEGLQTLYPYLNCWQELRNMAGWLDSNPRRQKTLRGMKRFVHTWLKDENRKAIAQILKESPPRGPSIFEPDHPAWNRPARIEASAEGTELQRKKEQEVERFNRKLRGEL